MFELQETCVLIRDGQPNNIKVDLNCIPELLGRDITKAITEQNMNKFKEVLNQNLPSSNYTYPSISNVEFNVTSLIRELVNLICKSYRTIKIPGSEFIEECFRTIEDHFEIGIVNCAAWLVDPKFMADLLIYPAVSVDSKYQNLTPLNILAKNLNAENFDCTFECIKYLVDYGANPNLSDEQNKTPISNLTDKNELDVNQIVIYFLDHTDIELDDTTEQYFKQKFPNRQFRNKSLIRFSSSELLEEFETSCSNLQKDEFLTQFNKLNNSYQQTNNLKTYEQLLELLILAIRYKLHKAFDDIIVTGLNINFRCRGYTPIKTACYYGNSEALKKLLNYKPRKTDKLLITVILGMKKATDDNISDYYSCFHTLLDSEININETDYKSYSVLHYAVSLNKSELIQDVFKRGAYMGATNIYDELAINGISPIILEQCFDLCINTNESVTRDVASLIIINYINLIPPQIDEHSSEMDVIEHIAKMENLCHLLKHPLIMSFLQIKWVNVPPQIPVDSMCFSNFLICFYTMVMMRIIICLTTDVDMIFFIWFNEDYIFFAFGLVYLVLRESIQFIITPISYLKDFKNYLRIFLIILIIILLRENYVTETTNYLATFTIVLLLWEIYVQLSSNLITSTYMLMFKKVSISFLKSFLAFAFLILGFSDCFFILFELQDKINIMENDTEDQNFEYDLFEPFNTTESNIMENDTEDKNFEYDLFEPFNTTESNITENDNEDQNTEYNLFKPFYIKSIVMMIGELDAANIKFHSYFHCLYFLVFVFFISIVLNNLLNGLAVGDIQAIRDQAELYELINITKVLSKYCKIFKKNKKNIDKNVEASKISKFFFYKFYQNLQQCLLMYSLDDFILFKYGNVGWEMQINICNSKINLIKRTSENTDTIKCKSIVLTAKGLYFNKFKMLSKINNLFITNENINNFDVLTKSALAIIDKKQENLVLTNYFKKIDDKFILINGGNKLMEDNLGAQLKNIKENLEDRLKLIEEGNKLREENWDDRLKKIDEGNKLMEENLEAGLKNIGKNLDDRLKLIEEGNTLREENLDDRLKKIDRGNKLMEENLEARLKNIEDNLEDRLKKIEEGNSKIFKFMEEKLSTNKHRNSF